MNEQIMNEKIMNENNIIMNGESVTTNNKNNPSESDDEATIKS